jgi:hypothetical protein
MLFDTISPAAAATARTNLHSITLLNVLQRSKALSDAIEALPGALGLFFDEKLYAANPQSFVKTNFLDRLLIQEVSAPLSGVTLDRFAADLQKLSGDSGVVQSNPKLQEALIASAIEYYYTEVSSYPSELFNSTNQGAQTFEFTSEHQGSESNCFEPIAI